MRTLQPLSVRSSVRRGRAVSNLMLGALVFGGSLGCGHDATSPGHSQTRSNYFFLRLNHHAITMALTPPYDTLRLVATPQAADGTALPNTGPTMYTLSDSSGVKIDATGLLTALTPDNQVQVIATHTIGNLTKADTAVVNVNDVSPVPTFTTLSMQFLPGDSARSSTWISWYQRFSDTLVVQVLDARGDTIPNIQVKVQNTQNQSVTDFTYLYNYPFYPFSPTTDHSYTDFTVEATVYNTRKVDTVRYLVGWPLSSIIRVQAYTPSGSTKSIGLFSPQSDTVSVGAIVAWINLSGVPIDVIFDTPAAAQGVDSLFFTDTSSFIGDPSLLFTIPNEQVGNIAAFGEYSALVDFPIYDNLFGQPALPVPIARARRFPTAGTYHYHSALDGTTGVLYVMPQFSGLPTH